MNRPKTVPFLLVTIVCFASSSFAKEDSFSELTGIFRRPKGVHQLELVGPHAGRWLHLQGDMLKDVPEGARIWLKGEIKTKLMEATMPGVSMSWARHWRIIVVVKEYKKISEPFERPRTQEPQNLLNYRGRRYRVQRDRAVVAQHESFRRSLGAEDETRGARQLHRFR